MKKSLILMLLFFAVLGSTIAQDATPADTTYWRKGFLGTASFTQVSLTNWAAGGQNSISLGGYMTTFANYAKDRNSWENYLELGYGLIKQGDADFQKTNDKINIVSKFGRKMSQAKDGRLYFSSLIDFRTQFAPGFSAPGDEEYISKFMAPGYALVATGVDIKVNPSFSVNFAPVTGKFTFVNDDRLANAGAFGVEGAVFDTDGVTVLTPGKKARAELGSFLKVNYKKEVVSNVNVESRLEMFSNYLNNPQNIDVNWENIIILKVNEWLSTSFITQLIYDDDIKIAQFDEAGVQTGAGPRVQFKQLFGIGLTVKMGDKLKK
ncbi:DUF3078 domain-containing protein [Imperialibacter roseus]|uniref:DUF3078 domain-containing protein n=1 Tax=Imperialibacter roseus TaxID=1324217 RepID=A0ABZ0IZ94_9BACT|nr:DUF3078 domain-containing protein [Imperialibacter roseus]WOK09683.1 DUF3078 domain-containing protein [Imperialibacter roseus]